MHALSHAVVHAHHAQLSKQPSFQVAPVWAPDTKACALCDKVFSVYVHQLIRNLLPSQKPTPFFDMSSMGLTGWLFG